VSGRLALAGAAFLYGSTFVVVQRATEDLTPAAFLAIRFSVGVAALALWPRLRPRPLPGVASRSGLATAGAAAGAALLAGYALQTVGLQYTSTSSSAFITGLFVVFTPLLGALVLRRHLRPPTLVAVALATAGLFLLTGADVRFSRGDALTLGCAVAFAAHILVVGEVAGRFDAVRLNRVQLGVVAGGAALALPLTGLGRVSGAALAGAAFTGVVASALAFTLQLHGQRYVGPAESALLLSLEPVFAGAFGYAVGERLGAAGVVGAALILVAVAVAQSGPTRRPAGRLDRAV